ncbi:hypothetical protein [Rikenella microfusus]|uniref:hypothetical protein n=1 Tax=Rikenella microfusus TaxID=28139 RepID=UPI0011C026B6|nr:hypothetical protein [Rikenella microfusus]
MKHANIEQEYRDSFAKIASRASGMSVDKVAAFVKRDLESDGSFSLDVIAYGRQVTERKSTESQADYRITLNSLERFAGGPLDISAVTARLLGE